MSVFPATYPNPPNPPTDTYPAQPTEPNPTTNNICCRWAWSEFLEGYIEKIEGFTTSAYSRGMHEFVVDYFEDDITGETGLLLYE